MELCPVPAILCYLCCPLKRRLRLDPPVQSPFQHPLKAWAAGHPSPLALQDQIAAGDFPALFVVLDAAGMLSAPGPRRASIAPRELANLDLGRCSRHRSAETWNLSWPLNSGRESCVCFFATGRRTRSPLGHMRARASSCTALRHGITVSKTSLANQRSCRLSHGFQDVPVLLTDEAVVRFLGACAKKTPFLPGGLGEATGWDAERGDLQGPERVIPPCDLDLMKQATLDASDFLAGAIGKE